MADSHQDGPSLERRSRRAWKGFLAMSANWSWWVGLTFAADVSEKTAHAALRWWLRYLARDVIRAHFKFASVIGRQASGRLHFHVLVEVPPVFSTPLDPAWATIVWKRAPYPTQVSWADRFDPARGAVGYAVLRHHQPEFNMACPRTGDCAHRRCALAPPWK